MQKIYSLQLRIFFMLSILLLVTLGLETLIFNRLIAKRIIQEGEEQTLAIADIIAKDPEIIEAFDTDNPARIIQPITRELQIITDVSFIVVMNMDAIRYSHPKVDRIGKHFVGGDEQAALQGARYVSQARGTLGISLRAFVPIVEDGRQIGVVSVGKLLNEIEKQQRKYTAALNLLTLGALTIGFLGAIIMARNIKRTIFGLEPYEIAELLEERDTILSSINEGIIAIDREDRVIELNENAKRLLSLGDNSVGRPIQELFPETRLPDVIKSGTPIVDQEEIINGKVLLTSRKPMVSRREIIGAVASFRDMSEIKKLAEELTEVKSYINALRAQHHEHLNKLHVISGLIQLQRFDEATRYITLTMTKQQKQFDFLREHIVSSAISALLLAKIREAEENHITCTIDPATTLPQVKEAAVDALITIIGNLLQNSIEALKEDQRADKYVSIFIKRDFDQVLIHVQDNGPGIPPDLSKLIFNNGFTTKEESGNRGYGLYLVKRHVQNLDGCISTCTHNGTHFSVRIPADRVLRT